MINPLHALGISTVDSAKLWKWLAAIWTVVTAIVTATYIQQSDGNSTQQTVLMTLLGSVSIGLLLCGLMGLVTWGLAHTHRLAFLFTHSVNIVMLVVLGFGGFEYSSNVMDRGSSDFDPPPPATASSEQALRDSVDEMVRQRGDMRRPADATAPVASAAPSTAAGEGATAPPTPAKADSGPAPAASPATPDREPSAAAVAEPETVSSDSVALSNLTALYYPEKDVYGVTVTAVNRTEQPVPLDRVALSVDGVELDGDLSTLGQCPAEPHPNSSGAPSQPSTAITYTVTGKLLLTNTTPAGQEVEGRVRVDGGDVSGAEQYLNGEVRGCQELPRLSLLTSLDITLGPSESQAITLFFPTALTLSPVGSQWASHGSRSPVNLKLTLPPAPGSVAIGVGAGASDLARTVRSYAGNEANESVHPNSSIPGWRDQPSESGLGGGSYYLPAWPPRNSGDVIQPREMSLPNRRTAYTRSAQPRTTDRSNLTPQASMSGASHGF